MLTLIRMGICKAVCFFVVFFGVGGCQFDSPFIFQEKLIQYQYNFIQLLNNLFKVGSRQKVLTSFTIC